MMSLAKEVEEKGYKTREQGKKIKSLIGTLTKGEEFEPLLGMIEELGVTWRKVGNRCRPYRVEATWKVNLGRTEIDATLATKPSITNGTTNSMDIRIVLYPVSGRVHATLELAS